MEEIPHHLGCKIPCKYWDKLPINWCRISSINSTFDLFAKTTFQWWHYHNVCPEQSRTRLLGKKAGIAMIKISQVDCKDHTLRFHTLRQPTWPALVLAWPLLAKAGFGSGMFWSPAMDDDDARQACWKLSGLLSLVQSYPIQRSMTIMKNTPRNINLNLEVFGGLTFHISCHSHGGCGAKKPHPKSYG